MNTYHTHTSDDDTLRLPDGSVYRSWEVDLEPTRTYHVDQRHPDADDASDGSADAPFRTIQAAAEVVAQGERVLIHPGVYRETVRPRRGGSGPDAMIDYEAAAGSPGDVVVTGAERYEGPWEVQDRYVNGWEDPRVAPMVKHGPPVYHLRLPRAWFVGYLPFGMINFPQHALDNGKMLENYPQQHLWKLLLKRGLVFQDGRRLEQVRRLGDLADAPGRYWCESTGADVYVRPFDDAAPAGSEWELTAREQCFAPDAKNLDYIRIKGLTFRHAADGFTWLQRAAVSSSHGTHWIVEHCHIHDVNANGVDFGTEHPNIRNKPEQGYDIIRRNVVQRCGLAGIVGSNGRAMNQMLVEDNLIEGCGWHGVERMYESAGLKMHWVHDSVFRRNLIRDNPNAAGLWLDFGISNTRITGNVILDHTSGFGGVFIEAAKEGVTQIDHNLIGGNRKVAPMNATDDTAPVNGGHGIYSHDCDRLLIAHNLVFDCEGSAAHVALGQPDRFAVTGRGAMCRHNRVVNNLFVKCDRSIHFGRPDNTACGNAHFGPKRGGPFQIGEPRENPDFEAWTEFLHQGRDSAFHPEAGPVVRQDGSLALELPGSLPRVPPVENVSRGDGQALPGPFPDPAAYEQPIPLDPRRAPADTR